MGSRKPTPSGVIQAAESAGRRAMDTVAAFVVSLPAKYGNDAADRFPPELPARFDDAHRRGQVDVFTDAAGIEWLRGDAAMYVDPNHFHASDLPPGLRAAAKVSVGRLADPTPVQVAREWFK